DPRWRQRFVSPDRRPAAAQGSSEGTLTPLPPSPRGRGEGGEPIWIRGAAPLELLQSERSFRRRGSFRRDPHPPTPLSPRTGRGGRTHLDSRGCAPRAPPIRALFPSPRGLREG